MNILKEMLSDERMDLLSWCFMFLTSFYVIYSVITKQIIQGEILLILSLCSVTPSKLGKFIDMKYGIKEDKNEGDK